MTKKERCQACILYGNRNIMKQIAGVAEMNDMALKEADMRTKQGKELKNATDTLC